MLKFLQPTPIRPDEGSTTRTGYAVATVLVALAMFAAASGSGNPDTPLDVRPPAWIDTVGNVLAATLGCLVLVPVTRIYAAVVAAVLMVVSMYLNYTIDGVAFFLQALPFNVLTVVLALLVAQRQRS